MLDFIIKQSPFEMKAVEIPVEYKKSGQQCTRRPCVTYLVLTVKFWYRSCSDTKCPSNYKTKSSKGVKGA